jgi:hypothetical protein
MNQIEDDFWSECFPEVSCIQKLESRVVSNPGIVVDLGNNQQIWLGYKLGNGEFIDAVKRLKRVLEIVNDAFPESENNSPAKGFWDYVNNDPFFSLIKRCRIGPC